MGPIMLDVHGTSLTPEDKELLQHPLVGGLIYFARNYESPKQIASLSAEIRKVVNRDFLIAVDHEGGRVQRFRDGFTRLPAMGKLWSLANENIKQAQIIAEQCGIIIATEVKSVGIDISFAPVIDLNGISDVIGDRSFHHKPDVLTLLASAFIDGMNKAGMLATGKHFPGHGSVKADSHIDSAIDNRDKNNIFNQDILPFKSLIQEQKLAAIMPAHVIYPQVDSYSVGFSSYWLQNILREELGFEGVIFSDDLSMEGASSIGGYIERSEAAQQAGCDMLLLCNNRDACIDVIDNANIEIKKQSALRIKTMLQKQNPSPYQNSALWQRAHKLITSYIA